MWLIRWNLSDLSDVQDQIGRFSTRPGLGSKSEFQITSNEWSLLNLQRETNQLQIVDWTRSALLLSNSSLAIHASFY